jgi:hypothetical protein
MLEGSFRRKLEAIAPTHEVARSHHVHQRMLELCGDDRTKINAVVLFLIKHRSLAASELWPCLRSRACSKVVSGASTNRGAKRQADAAIKRLGVSGAMA